MVLVSLLFKTKLMVRMLNGQRIGEPLRQPIFQMDIENYDLYNLKIFNRYGELVFESAKPSYTWNGKQDNVGNDLPESTYFYVFRYRYNCDGKIREVEGLVDLIR